MVLFLVALKEGKVEYIQQFLSARKLDGLASGTLDQYKRELLFLSPFLNKSTLEATTNDLRTYFIQFNDMAQNSVSRKISTVRAFYQWLVDEEILNRNPMKRIRTPKESMSLPKNLSKEDFERLRYFKKSLRNQAIFELLASSGMRVSEMTALNIHDIDFVNRQIKVLGKGNKERMVHFSPVTKFCLSNYLVTRKDDSPALFINKYGERLSIRSIEMQIKAWAIKAGIHEKVTPHVLRHTFASNLYRNGADLGFISMELGHSSPEVTMRYARLDNQTRANMHDRFLGF
jgi:integrase/recombinase XerD